MDGCPNSKYFPNPYYPAISHVYSHLVRRFLANSPTHPLIQYSLPCLVDFFTPIHHDPFIHSPPCYFPVPVQFATFRSSNNRPTSRRQSCIVKQQWSDMWHTQFYTRSWPGIGNTRSSVNFFSVFWSSSIFVPYRHEGTTARYCKNTLTPNLNRRSHFKG